MKHSRSVVFSTHSNKVDQYNSSSDRTGSSLIHCSHQYDSSKSHLAESESGYNNIIIIIKFCSNECGIADQELSWLTYLFDQTERREGIKDCGYHEESTNGKNDTG